MVNGIATSAYTSLDSESTKTEASKKDIVSKDAFLQLLVAQIKHQDPLNPSDGVQFLTQLAQFSELEQLMSMGTDISGIRESINTPPVTEEAASTKE